MSLNQDLSRCSTPLHQGNLLPLTLGIQITAMYNGDSNNGHVQWDSNNDKLEQLVMFPFMLL